MEFSSAGPPRPTLDMERLVRAKIGGGPYRVVPSEVIELTMPAILQVVTAAEPGQPEENMPFICRIGESGDIVLPVVGEIKASGKTLAQIETEVTNAYYPEYIAVRPSVFARVLEYKTSQVTISGAVNKPGIYSLRSDQMSIVGLLMEAGGIIEEGAASITINRRNSETINNSGSYEEMPQSDERQISSPLTKKDYEGQLRYTNFKRQSSEFTVQLKFRQLSRQNTNGIITVLHQNEIILAEQINIANEMERLIFLNHLSEKDPRILTGDIKQKLDDLANILRPKSEIQDQNIDLYPSTFNEINKSNKTKLFNLSLTSQFDTSQYHTQPSQNVAQEKRFVITDENQKSMSADEKKDFERLKQSSSIVLPIKGYNIPFADLALHDGDSVIVERLDQPMFSVIGLVLRPGNFPYPPGMKYNLIQALAFAGGLDPATEPRYATIYRLKPDGQVVHAAFEIVNFKDGSRLTDSLSIPVKPGDIIAVEQTPRTRTKQFLDSVFRLNIGTYYNLGDAWTD